MGKLESADIRGSKAAEDGPEHAVYISLHDGLRWWLLVLSLLIACPSYADTVLVTLEKDNALAVVDDDAMELTRTVKIGRRPRDIKFSPDYRKLYVAASDDDTIQVLDGETYKIIGDLPSGDDPETFAIDPKGERMYVSNEDDNQVTVIDLASGEVVKTIPVGVEPEGIAVSPDGRWVVSTSETTNMAHWIDTQTLEIAHNTLVDPRPRAATFTADSKQLWVTSEIGSTLTVIDASSQQEVKKLHFKIPGVTQELIQPVGVVVDSRRRYGYVALGPANRVAVVDAQKLEVVKYLLTGQRVWHLAFANDGKRLYTTNGTSHDVTVIDTARLKPIKSIPVGHYPWGVAVKP
ncbi:MAG: YVTN family beta-propeller repeat protein [Methylohalobius crimeensis]